MEQQLFGLHEAAEILGVSFSWLEKRIRNGDVPFVQMGGKRMLSDDHIKKIKKEGIK